MVSPVVRFGETMRDQSRLPNLTETSHNHVRASNKHASSYSCAAVVRTLQSKCRSRFLFFSEPVCRKEGPSIDLVTSSEQAKDVILRMLAFRENERPSALECLQMPWFTSEKKKYVELSNKQVRALVDHAEREAPRVGPVWFSAIVCKGSSNFCRQCLDDLPFLV